MLQDGSNYFDGTFHQIESNLRFQNIDPCTEKSIGEFPQTSFKEVNYVCESAKKSFVTWRELSRVKRAEYLLKVAEILAERKEELATAISLETGKNYNESIAEVNEALHMAQYAFSLGRMPYGEMVASEISDKDCYMLRKPKGLVAIISPWNFPLAIGAFWCAAPALLEGNTVVLKPSEDAPLTSQLATEIYHDAGLPEGVFNLIHGDGTVGNWLALNNNVDHICFTGSAEVGQHIRRTCAESWHKTCSCEMGSKSAVIVFNDANIELAAPSCLASAFKLSGQRCVSAGRLIVQRDVYDKFIDRFMQHALQVEAGPPFVDNGYVVGGDVRPSEYYMGPLINRGQAARVVEFNEMVFEDSEAEVLLSGERIKPGFFVTPTVYKTEWRDVPYLKNEVFGPHVAIIPFDSISDAIRIYNDTDYGLAVGVITEDFKKARICRDSCDFGMCYWNGGSIAAESHLAFGGVKKSGNGYPSAARTVRAVTHEVSWTVNHEDKLSFPQGMK